MKRINPRFATLTTCAMLAASGAVAVNGTAAANQAAAANGTAAANQAAAANTATTSGAAAAASSVAASQPGFVGTTERLDRGLISIRTAKGNFLSWRLLRDDPAGHRLQCVPRLDEGRRDHR